MHSLYRSSTQGPEDDSVESKHVAPLSHYMFNFATVVFHGTSSTRGPEDDSVQSKHVAPLSHSMFNFTIVVFDGTSPPPPFISQTLRDGTPQVQAILSS